MNQSEFIFELEKIGITITSNQLKQLEKYYHLLIEWNKKINLTRIVEKSDVYLKHFYDSLTLIKVIDLNKKIKLCDVGTGAGFPGIVLKIVFPNLDITLIDSLNKRVVFLNNVINELGLQDISAIHTRMEDYSRKNREVFDIITSRAVAKTNILSEISIPALKVAGHLLLMKSSVDEELASSKDIMNKLDSKINKIIKFNLPKEDSLRTIIDIVKVSKTHSMYPRSIDRIKKAQQ